MEEEETVRSERDMIQHEEETGHLGGLRLSRRRRYIPKGTRPEESRSN